MSQRNNEIRNYLYMCKNESIMTQIEEEEEQVILRA